MGRSPRSRAALERTRSAILDAAARAFARRGFAGITMDDLAKEAGYSTASLYNYFPNKDAVLNALVARSIEGLLRCVKAPLPVTLSPEQRLELVALRLLEEARDHLWLMALVMSHAMASDNTDPGSVTSQYMAVHDSFMSSITALVAALDWLPNDQAERVAHHFMSGIRTENFLWIVNGPPDDLAPLAHELVCFWLAGTRALVDVS